MFDTAPAPARGPKATMADPAIIKTSGGNMYTICGVTMRHFSGVYGYGLYVNLINGQEICLEASGGNFSLGLKRDRISEFLARPRKPGEILQLY